MTRQFKLKYIDAHDLRSYLFDLLSEADGDKVSVYSPSARARFAFGTKVSEVRSVQYEDRGKVTRRSRILTVTARPDTMSIVEERIAELDVMPHRIEIEVKVVQITLDHRTQSGVDWNAVLSVVGSARPTTLPWGPHSGEFFPGNFPAPPTGFVFGQLRADELTAVLRMISARNDVEIVSEPNICTLDNVEASILIGTKFPVTTETIDPQTAVRTVTLDYYEDIGIQLNVIPSVSEGNRIHLIIHPAVSSLGDLIDDRFPIINTREADTQLLLRSGETAIIGGLLERHDTDIRRGIPILEKLPLLGDYLFSFKDRQEIKTELVIFVTPRLILDRDEVTKSLQLDPRRVEALSDLYSSFESVLER